MRIDTRWDLARIAGAVLFAALKCFRPEATRRRSTSNRLPRGKCAGQIGWVDGAPAQ